jgi:hypothetical protein
MRCEFVELQAYGLSSTPSSTREEKERKTLPRLRAA